MRSSKAPADMPVGRNTTGATGDGDTADMQKNVQQHGFCGDTCEIKLFKGDKEDPRQQFFALNNYHVTIRRDHWVRVPVEMADHIESLAFTVKDADPNDPENEDKFVWAEKARFPLQRRG